MADLDPPTSPREAAFLAVLKALKEEAFVSDFLNRWEKSSHPSKQDLHLAWEIANGCVRMRLALDYLAKQAAGRSKLSMKAKERALLHTALYQVFYLSRIPLYAIVNETVAIAHRHCHPTFVRFLNAILRQLEKKPLTTPQGNSLEDLSIRYSYPLFFVQELVKDYGLEVAQEILEIENRPPTPMVRHRSPLLDVRPIDKEQIEALTHSSDQYIQNITQASLIWKLAEGREPSSILDLCASPGGKLLALHDRFPEATLFANDVSEEKLKRLKENCSKYNLQVTISCSRGELFAGKGPYDLVVLDVPCSNSGVLNKRPEARWRLSEEHLQQLAKTQLALLERARQIVAPGGEVWYLTCSLLKRENEEPVARACQLYGFTSRIQLTYLPNLQGWEGGFGSALEPI
jgi:16S rRNA (cytosine967-C5)-methyltransferase